MHSKYYGDGGRLDGRPQDVLINTAYAHDCADAKYLIDGLHKADLAHVMMLINQAIIPEDAGRILLKGLLELEAIPASKFPIDPANGDVYNSKDVELRALIGDDAGWLHIGRPRREAVNIGYLIATRSRILTLSETIVRFARALLKLAKDNQDVVAPDFTYLLHAHPTRLGHYLMTFLFGLLRDMDRVEQIYERFNQSPAGSGSVNGSALPMDRKMLSDYLGFDKVISHSRDGMWQVDMPMEIMSELSMLMTNLNRMADEFQIWNTAEFGTIDLPDTLCRASVIMPQKKNPYPLAYFRGVSSWLVGKSASFAAYGKGPSGNPDSRIFIYGELPEALDKVRGALNLFAAVLDDLTFKNDVLKKRATHNHSFATDLADHLTYKEKLDYRTAHQISGRLVKIMLEKELDGTGLTVALVNEASMEVIGKPVNLPEDLIDLLKDPAAIAASRQTIGGAGDESMATLFAEAEERISAFDNWLKGRKPLDFYSKLDRAVSNFIDPKGNFAELFIGSAKTYADKTAIIEGKNRSFTYGEILAQAQKISDLLGDRAGERVAIRIDDKPNLIAAIIAVHLSHGTVVSLDVSSTNGITQMVENSGPAHILYDPTAITEDVRGDVAMSWPKIKWIAAPDVDAIAGKKPNFNAKYTPPAPGKVAHLFYTSGTTGRRKGVAIDHEAYVVPGHSLNRGMGYDDSVREYVAGNISHAFPFGRVRAVFFVGGTVILDNGNIMPQKVISSIANHEGNAIGAPASVVMMLLSHFRQAFSGLADNLRWIKMGTQAVSVQAKADLVELFPKTKIVHQYGTSESPRTVFNDIRLASNPRTTGRPLPGYRVSVRDEDGHPILEAGRKGRVWMTGPHIAQKYWENAEKTEEAFQDGWFVTDDIGEIDEEGQIYLHGRRDEIINFGGQKLAPAEIEETLRPYLEDLTFVVFGVADPSGLLGEVPAICIQTDGDAKDGLDKYSDWPKRRMAIVKAAGKSIPFIPKVAFGIGEIPMTSSGKPKRKILSEMGADFLQTN